MRYFGIFDGYFRQLYIRNSKSERRMADAFTYLMLSLNLLIVCLIVYKTVAFPCRTEVRFWTEILDDFRRFVDEIWRF